MSGCSGRERVGTLVFIRNYWFNDCCNYLRAHLRSKLKTLLQITQKTVCMSIQVINPPPGRGPHVKPLTSQPIPFTIHALNSTTSEGARRTANIGKHKSTAVDAKLCDTKYLCADYMLIN